ncbi:methylase [Mesorhizobium sp. Root695]|uniref:class I SAM-dependent DNA methyltransferase n=1 Tax=Mesorhizobium sp. Root695 TaxID=1736589 RepID=UPI0007090115|nr:methylase [Mesorhizobium sp. Root695]
MRLSWNEIRARAARFADEWKDAHYEKGETQTFYNEFFEIFGVTRRRVASFEEPVKKLGKDRGFIDLFWKGLLLVEQKSAGKNLVKAKAQALDYFPGLKEIELPRFILLSDFQTFELYDLEQDSEVKFSLSELPRHIEKFGFILGIQTRTFLDQDPVNIVASELMGKLHDALKASGYDGHDLERFLVRVVFCLFADDTGIFEPRGIFQDLIEQRTHEDGSDVGQWISHLFDVLNTPPDRRQKSLDEDLTKFPYINGDLFAERLPIPAFDAAMRGRLVEACDFFWDAISPAIFGSLFQSVMKKKERRAVGAHYTTEKNILKVIEPLFLDDLRAEFTRLKARRDTGRTNVLKAFQDKLGSLKLIDPACGCGNFLIIAYRELRALEIELLRELNPKGQRVFDVSSLSKVNVNQFYGIEIGEFPARIAEVALWMMDHIMNNRLSLEFGENYARIPLEVAPHIHHADALDTDWADVLPPAECSYILGNPPFIGFVMRGAHQQDQATGLMNRLGASGSRLDYVGAWFLKAAEYLQESRARIGFVSTNSITQGEQVAALWPAIFGRYGLEIAFAHRTFAWGSDARGKAHVHCVIIGLTRRDDEVPEKRLFSYHDTDSNPDETLHKSLSPYLFDASRLANRHLVVQRTRRPQGGVPTIRVGSKPVDGGYLIMSGPERAAFIQAEPDAAELVRPYVGSNEHINGGDRWILTLRGVGPNRLRSMPLVMDLVEKTRRYRLGQLPPRDDPEGENKTASALSKSLASTPTEFHVTVLPTSSFLAIPEVSSERREYLPVAWLEPPTVPSNKLLIATGVELHHFGLIVSKMHMAWVAFVGGRLKSDYQYSPGINYNPFPWPALDNQTKTKIDLLAQAVLDARAAHPQASLGDLYDPDVMPPLLRKAHRALDAAVDRLFRSSPFVSDRERVEHLFALYESAIAPLTTRARASTGRKRVAKKAAG